MTAINFPANPSNGDTHQGFVYNSTLGVWQSAGSQTAVTSFTGLSDTPSTLGTAGQIAKVNSGATALEFADQSGVTVYANADALPGSGNAGDLAFVTATNRLYIWNGSGWYNIALINTNPTISGVNSSYSLATDGTATTVTITATDPEGLPITYSIASDTSGNIATVTQGTGASTNVFTITPSTNNANGGTFSLTFRASDGVNIATAPASFTLQFSIQNSNYTTALITSVGANLAVNNSFVDSSTSSHTLTATGNPTQNTFSPYRHGGYSTYFDGTGDYVTAPSDTSFDFGTGDFTIETWINIPDVTSAWLAFISRGYAINGGWRLYKNTGNNNLRFYYTDSGTTSYIEASSTGITNNTWHHIAVVRNSSTTTIYVDGVSKTSGTITTSLNPGSYAVEVGSGVVTSSYPVTGNMADVRIVKGTAVYTSDFTPPTERLTAITNTSLLTCHLPYIADGSTNGHSITLAGNIKTEPFAPYDSSAPYSASTNGGSIYFDGSSRLEAADSADWNQDTDFTIEAWFYPKSIPGQYVHMFGQWQSGGGGNRNTQLTLNPSGGVFMTVNRSGTNYSTPVGTTLKINNWYHIAVTLSGTTLTVWVNGKNDGSITVGGSSNDSSMGWAIGGEPGSGSYPFTGNIAETRVIKGTALYTAAFTPPTAPLTAITNTKLLLSGTNAGIIDKSQSRKFLTLSGDSKSSTTQSKYLSSSMYFDGSGDNILTDVMTTNGDFTVEMWIRFDGSVSNPASQSPTFFVWGTTTFMLYCTIANNTMQMIGNGSGLISGSTTISADTWYHVAFARQGNTGRLFVDGNLEGSTTSFTTDLNARAVIGSEENAGYPAKAYMSDVRITKGLARYTTAFTPPTAELQG